MAPLPTLRLCGPVARAQGASRPPAYAHLKFVRANSQTARPPPAKSASPAATTKKLEASLRARAKIGEVPSEVEKQKMPWEEYLAVRKNKRRWETVSIQGSTL